MSSVIPRRIITRVFIQCPYKGIIRGLENYYYLHDQVHIHTDCCPVAVWRCSCDWASRAALKGTLFFEEVCPYGPCKWTQKSDGVDTLLRRHSALLRLVKRRMSRSTQFHPSNPIG